MRFFAFLKKTAIVLLCLSVLLVAGGFLCVHSYNRFDKEGQASCLANYTHAAGNYYLDVTPNDECLIMLQALVSSLSSNVSDAFLKDWKVIISPNMPDSFVVPEDKLVYSGQLTNGSEEVLVLGYSNWHLRTMFIRAQQEPTSVLKVFAHELGHYFDYEFGSPSASAVFGKIYREHKDSFTEHDSADTIGYSAVSQQEFFATVFKEYLLAPRHLKAVAPDAYDYIDGIYKDVSNNPAASTTVKYDLESAIVVLKKNLSR